MQEMVARFNRALADRDSVAAAGLFVEDGVFETTGEPEVRGRAAIERALAALPAEDARDWVTNFIIEGDSETARLRAYHARVTGNQVIRTGRHEDTLSKQADGSFKFVRRNLVVDSRPA
jgi:uncharacterized protein (TIGR02246 family)